VARDDSDHRQCSKERAPKGPPLAHYRHTRGDCRLGRDTRSSSPWSDRSGEAGGEGGEVIGLDIRCLRPPVLARRATRPSTPPCRITPPLGTRGAALAASTTFSHLLLVSKPLSLSSVKPCKFEFAPAVASSPSTPACGDQPPEARSVRCASCAPGDTRVTPSHRRETRCILSPLRPGSCPQPGSLSARRLLALSE
jgi:hypothetical protein